MNYTPPAPTDTAKKPAPSLSLNQFMQILSVDDAARRIGISPGDELTAHLPSGELLRHRAYCRRDPGTPCDPLGTPQNCAVFAFGSDGFYGFEILYVEYAYTLRSYRAEARLFPTLRDYLLFASETDGPRAEGRRALSRAARTIRTDYDALFQGNAAKCAVSSEAFASAALLALDCFQPYMRGVEEPLYDLRRFLDGFLPRLQQNTFFIDCALTLSADAAAAARVNADRLCFLLTALCGVLNDLSEDRRIAVSLRGYGNDLEIRLTTAVGQLPPFLSRTTDLLALTSAAPAKTLSLTLAEYVAGYSGWHLAAVTESGGRRLSFSLLLPAARPSEDFHSPFAAQSLMNDAFATLGALCALLYAEEQKKDHDHVH